MARMLGHDAYYRRCNCYSCRDNPKDHPKHRRRRRAKEKREWRREAA